MNDVLKRLFESGQLSETNYNRLAGVAVPIVKNQIDAAIDLGVTPDPSQLAVNGGATGSVPSSTPSSLTTRDTAGVVTGKFPTLPSSSEAVGELAGKGVGAVGKVLGQGLKEGFQANVDAAKMITAPVVDAGKGFLKGLGLGSQAPRATADTTAGTMGPTEASASTPDQSGPPVGPKADTETVRLMGVFNALKQAGVDEKKLAAAFGMQQAGVMDAAKAGAQQAAAEAGYLGEVAAQSEKFLAEQNLRNQERETKVNEQLGKLENELETFKTTTIDPNRYFKNRSTFDSIMSAIGIAFGGGVQGLRGGSNPALEMLNREIDRDIAAQKAELEKRSSVVSYRRGLVADMRDTFKDRDLADQAARASYYQLAQTKLNQIAAQYKAPQLQAQAKQLYGQLEAQKLDALGKFRERTAALLQTQMGVPNADEMTRRIYTLPKEQQAKAFEEKAAYDNYVASTSEIDRAFEEASKIGTVSANIPFSEKKAAFESNSVKINSAIRSMFRGQGAFTDQDEKSLIMPLLPSSTDTVAQLQQKQAKLKELISSRLPKETPILSGFGLVPRPLKTLKPKE